MTEETTTAKTIYFDIDYNREDNQDQYGKTYLGLESRLRSLKRQYGEKFFPQWQEGEETLLDTFSRHFLPEELPLNFLTSNVSLKDNRTELAFRPIVGPRLQNQLPPGCTIVFNANAKTAHRSNPRLSLTKIQIVTDGPLKPFEKEICCHVNLKQMPRRSNSSNAINDDFLKDLPLISKVAQKQLKEWRSYLNWRRKVIGHRLYGFRFLAVENGEKYQSEIDFLLCRETPATGSREDNFKNLLKGLSFRENLVATKVSASEDNWKFILKMKTKGSTVDLGKFVKLSKISDQKGQQLLEESLESQTPKEGSELPFEHPQFFRATFTLKQEFADKLKKKQLDKEEHCAEILDAFPDAGFIAVSAVGDIAQLNRQEKAVNDLEKQSGYAPYLSSYMFDISQATVPQKLEHIEQWHHQDLNESQKECVQKMVSTPDIALIQGPPGTGKTTVIAEGVYQMVKNGERVLMVSQANLAVDNALERLAADPAIRTVRLGKNDKISSGVEVFKEDHSLKTFYKNIASKVQENHLSPWSQLQQQAEFCQQKADDLEVLADDHRQSRQKVEEFSQTLHDLKRKEKAEKNALAKADDSFKRKQNLKREAQISLENLRNNEWQNFQIPADTLSEIAPQFFSIARDARNAGLTLQLPSPPMASDNTLIQNDYCQALIQRYPLAEKSLPLVSTDLLELRQNGSLENTEIALEIDRLKTEKELLEEKMDTSDDPQIFERFRQIRSEINLLRKKNQGLNRDFYSRIVAENSILIQSGLTAESAIKSLLELEEGLKNFVSSMNHLLAIVEAKLENLVKEPLVEPNKSLLGEAQRESRRHSQNLQEWQEQLEHQTDLLSDVYKTISQEKVPVDCNKPLPQVIRTLREHAQSCLEQINGESSLCVDWKAFLQNWHGDLTTGNFNADFQHFNNDYLKNSNVVGISCNENPRTLEKVGSQNFDTVIIDEVSKATPPEMVMSLMRARRIILVGDHRQLPPVFQDRYDESWEELVENNEEATDSDTLLTRENLKRYEKMVSASLFKQHFENADERIKGTLYTQYRMHPQIMDLINVFYENRLVCGLANPNRERAHNLTLKSADGTPDFVNENIHACWIDSSCDPRGRKVYEEQEGTSKINQLEIDMIVETLQKINRAQEQAGGGKKEVGIISFYGKQVSAIKRAINPMRKQLKHLQIDINTVDRFQGKEMDVILVSMVRNSPSRFKGASSYVAQFERINVAFSRARQLLMIFGAKDMFQDYPVDLPNIDKPGKKRKKVYGNIISYLHRNAAFFPSSVILNAKKYESSHIKTGKHQQASPYKNTKKR